MRDTGSQNHKINRLISLKEAGARIHTKGMLERPQEEEEQKKEREGEGEAGLKELIQVKTNTFRLHPVTVRQLWVTWVVVRGEQQIP